ncbi:MAG TPA: YhdP family protein [Burkholderiales bacterium]|nr:YhdP family protein [Burkholderiales bacterium]
MPTAVLFRWLRSSSLTLYRLVTWIVLAAGLTFSGLVLGLRYWVLPNIDQHREAISNFASGAIGQRVTIGKVSGNWDGLQPEIVLADVTVFDREGRPALRLSRVESTLSWFSVAAWEPRFRAVEIDRPALDIRRDANGIIHVAGIALQPGGGGGFADWLLRQRKLVIRQAAITWHDELRGAAPLQLDAVELLVRNRGSRHRFGMRAVPPAAFAGPLDVRGELFGRSFSELADWHGRVYLKLDAVDLGAGHAWLPAALPVPAGWGALRLWIAFQEHRLREVTADVRLAAVRVQLASDLPQLVLAALSGRIGWKDVGGGMEFSTTGLTLTAENGLALEPTDFYLRLPTAGGTAARGELTANALALEPLGLLAERLPLDRALRDQLAAYSPRGTLYDLALRWNGDWRDPAEYTVRGRFDRLGASPVGKAPGFSGMSGAFEANEEGGSARLDSTGVTLDMPRVFRGPLDLERLTADIAWTPNAGSPEFRFNKVAFSNAHFDGTLAGTYRAVPDQRGVIDVTGALTRADARYVAQYVPLVIGPATREWLDTSLISGTSNDVTLRLKGDLTGFPFPDHKGGVFEVLAKVTGGVLDYANGWPRIENVAADVAFRGRRLDVDARAGTILGAKLLKVHAEIPDVVRDYEVLYVTGEAEGPSAEFLSFITRSPVLDMIDRFTEGMQVQGAGKLALKLEIPLRAREKSKVAGTYQFSGNRFVGAPELPPVEQVSGRLEFTESDVRVPGATGVFLGGPISLSSAAPGDATVRLNVEGRANVENVRQFAGNPGWMQKLSGAADWRGSLVLHKKLADLTIETNLQGVASELPEPLRKNAAGAVPLRFERRHLGESAGLADRIDISYGDILSARLVRHHEHGKEVIRRGTIRFGGTAPEPESDGLQVSGTLKQLNADNWLALGAPDADSAAVPISTVDLKFGELQMFNRTFHDVAVSGGAQDGSWRATLGGREFDGTLNWQSQGRGKLTARLKKLAIPAEAPAERHDPSKRGRELPAVDLVADEFQYKDKVLGKLELNATPVERDWRIDYLRLTNPDATLNVEGLVQDMAGTPRTRTVLHLEARDIGKTLARLGYPEGVRRGTAKLEGRLAWPGAPHDFEYGALSGNVTLDASKGQFVKLEPGIGKLLGILSLQALPRRITLDFRDIFSDGLAFDNIVGEINIERGIAKTDNFVILSPAARILMTGEVDLVRETQRLQVRVAPSLSESVAIASGLVGGPVAFVATLLAQKMLKDPLGRIIAYQYSITGTWSEPQVSKIGQPAPASGAKAD